METGGLTRRGMLKTAAVAALAAKAGRRAGAAPANDRITMGAIGVGARGTGDLRDFLQAQRRAGGGDVRRQPGQPVARDPLWQTSATATTTARDTRTFGRCWSGPDIDAVLIAAPHHWHVAMGVAAAKAGKDMYMEKPMAMAMSWAWDLAGGRRAVRRRCSSSARSSTPISASGTPRSWRAAGRLGKVEKALVLMPSTPGPNPPPPPPEPAPGYLDLDAWQGPALAAPYLGKAEYGHAVGPQFRVVERVGAAHARHGRVGGSAQAGVGAAGRGSPRGRRRAARRTVRSSGRWISNTERD